MEQLYLDMKSAFQEEAFLRKLASPKDGVAALFETVDWPALLAPLLPIQKRLSCKEALAAFRPVLERVALEPEEGWALYAYHVALTLLFPQEDPAHTPRQRDGALCALQFLRTLLDAERAAVPFDFWLDFAFCTEEELEASNLAEEYRQFLRRWREEYVYELLRLGREVTSFRTCEHIAGVHHVSMTDRKSTRLNSPPPPRATTLESLAASPGSGCPISTTTTQTSGFPGGVWGPWGALRPTTPYGTWSWRTCPPNPWCWFTRTSG